VHDTQTQSHITCVNLIGNVAGKYFLRKASDSAMLPSVGEVLVWRDLVLLVLGERDFVRERERMENEREDEDRCWHCMSISIRHAIIHARLCATRIILTNKSATVYSVETRETYTFARL